MRLLISFGIKKTSLGQAKLDGNDRGRLDLEGKIL